MFIAAALAILVTIALTLWRAFIGPTLFDRLLAVNSIGTKTVSRNDDQHDKQFEDRDPCRTGRIVPHQ